MPSVSGNQDGALWLQIFSCCSHPAEQGERQEKRRLDLSMIGEPTNFQHNGHIGSEDLEMVNAQLLALQHQMQSKGGYEAALQASNYSVY